MDESKFCVKCGANLPADAQYCNKCGAVVVGTEAEKKAEMERTEMENIMAESRMHWLVFLYLIYAIPVLVMGICMLVQCNTIINDLWNNADWLKYVSEHADITKDLVRSAITTVGVMGIISGVCAAIAAFTCGKRKWWILGVACSVISTCLTVWNIFGFIIGIFVTWMIISAKDDFVNDVPKEKA